MANLKKDTKTKREYLEYYRGGGKMKYGEWKKSRKRRKYTTGRTSGVSEYMKMTNALSSEELKRLRD